MNIEHMRLRLEGRLYPRGDDYKQSIALGLVRLGLPLGFVLFIPALLIAFQRRDLIALIADCSAFALLICLRFIPRISLKASQISIVAILLALGSYGIVARGFDSVGPVWLGSAAAIATVFYGLPGCIAVCAIEVTTFAGIFWAQGAADGAAGLFFLDGALDTIGLSILVSCLQDYLVRSLGRFEEAHDRLASELSEREIELERETAGRHDAEMRADFLTSHDALTRLPNRESFERELGRAIEVASGRGRILGVMTIGLDRFKRIGEIHGPAAGDDVLAQTAFRLRKAFRDDDIVARSGGDLFLALLSDVKSPEDARSILAKARQAFDRSFSLSGAEIGLSASFGLALYPNDSTKAGELIRQSEVALHLAKEGGPGSFRLYDAGLHARIIEEGVIEHEMHLALLSDAFLPWYQPKVDVLGRIVGVEALARWVLPEGGIRQPSQFIATAENSGFIAELGRIVLEKACASAAKWERSGLPAIPVSVNLSPYQFRSDGLVKEVRSILSSTGLDPSRLDLEITESGIMEDSGGAIDKLAELKSLGCSISIDDFGTGYSSFAALRDFPVDCVKLPQPFVEPLPADERASTIARAVIDLAHRLDFSVVAEGVENRAQFAWLGAARCDQYQGYLFSRPLPEAEFGIALARGLELAVE